MDDCKPHEPTLREVTAQLKGLRDYVDARDREYRTTAELREKALSIALTASDKAVGLAEANADKWRESANEWRSAMNDKDRNFVTSKSLWGYIVAAIMITIGIVEALQSIFAR